MTPLSLQELMEEREQVLPLTVEQYERMITGGILLEGEPCELIGGQVVRKERRDARKQSTAVGHQHAWVVKKLAALGGELQPFGCHMQTQQPISLPPHDEPEPDGAAVLGTEDDYRDHHPTAGDVICAIEVAGASLRRDRTTKLAVYAGSGIPHYLIINMLDRVIEVYSEPLRHAGEYGKKVTLTPQDTLHLPAGSDGELLFAVNRLLP